MNLSKEDCPKKSCEFKICPSNIDVEIKEIRPFCACNCLPLILNLEACTPCNVDICMEIESMPKHGKISEFESSILIYKADKFFCGMDKFKIRITDKFGRSNIETILICVND